MGQADDHTDRVQREHGLQLFLRVFRRCRLGHRWEYDTGPGRRLRLLIPMPGNGC
jgi:hypothetical protein